MPAPPQVTPAASPFGAAWRVLHIPAKSSLEGLEVRELLSDNAADTGGAPADAARQPPTHVVGIGASAGGLSALERFFSGLGDSTGMAYVVIQHLSPDFTSMMPQILARTTRMPIKPVESGSMPVERDTVYLIVPGKEMVIANNRLLTTDRGGGLSLPVDLFFRSLAEDQGSAAVGIILSGTGSDGANGIVELHRAGGLTIAQTLGSAEFDGMPKSAVATGTVDLVLDPEHMPAALAGHAKSLPMQFAQPGDHQASGLFDDVFPMLRERFDVDFGHYKPNTIIRRVERRMMVRQRESLNDYLTLLREDPQEVETLYYDLLIGVTRFFRDSSVWQFLETEIIPQIVRTEQKEVRVWSCGCATGEEPYSLAILFAEACDQLSTAQAHVPEIKIFATDVHQQSLHRAGLGVYDRAALEGLSEARLQQHFTPHDGDSYVVQPRLRKMVVFARQDVTVDPPFTKLDLVMCRNLLIYLNTDAQKKAITLFHFGLKRDGVLVLGTSEGLAELSSEFDAVDGPRQVFRKATDRHLMAAFKMPATRSGLRDHSGGVGIIGRPVAGRPAGLSRAYDALMDAYVPPGLLVSGSGEVAHTFGNANRFLKPPAGAVSLHASDLVVPELRLPIISALARVKKTQDVVAYAGIRVDLPGEQSTLVRLTCRPLAPVKSMDYLLLTFEESGAPATAEMLEQASVTDAAEDLESELKYTREQLQAAVEELETSNEELQATNEELIASNEELQSTNEELHSVNEELSTLNQEHEQKISQLEQMTEETDNLIESLDTSTLFVDRERRIRKFTPQAAAQFGLMKHDINRRISHFNTLLASRSVAQALDRVEQEADRVEEEVQDADGKFYLLRSHPYVRANGQPDGAVLSFVDIERIQHASQRVSRASKELQAFTYAVSHDLIGPVRRADHALDVITSCIEGDRPSRVDEGLTRLRRELTQINALVQGLLKLSRIETEGDAPVPVSLQAAVNAVVTELSTQLRDRDAHIDVGLLPSVLADNNQLRLLIYNLVRHALIVSSGQRLSLDISAREIGDRVVVTVADNGTAFSVKDDEQAFELFFDHNALEQRETIADASYGGLAMAKRIVERHGGEIWLEQPAKGGTYVSFSLRRGGR